jgi:DNA-binding NarL/FixJ family response regulator
MDRPVPKRRPMRDQPLTHREREVLALLAQGLRIHQIATQMNISQRTVHTHLERLYAKLGVHSRLEAVVQAYARGLVGREERRGRHV